MKRTVQHRQRLAPGGRGKTISSGNNNEGDDNNEDIGSKTFGKIPSSPSRRAAAAAGKPSSGVRAFVQANRNQNRLINTTAMFQNEQQKSDDISPALIKNARKSGVLNISGRSLINVPSKIWAINELDENEKSSVSVSLDEPSSEKWWEFVDLNKLIIANNCIKEIPEDIGNLVSLQVFDAHDNQIVKVSERIGDLTNLQKVDLSHNRLLELPQSFFNLKRLTELKLSHNNLAVISPEIGTLSCLRSLDLSHNHLTKIPLDLGFLSFLNCLNLAHNLLKELPSEIGSLTGLRSLDLSENHLTSCPTTLKDLSHLEILYLQRNKIRELPDLSGCKALKELYMQNNLLTEFNSETFELSRIQLLDFRSNKIEKLKVEKKDLGFVDRFYLDNNEIGRIPDGLCLLPSLKSLTLEGNPLHGIRLDILQRGTVELLKYLRGKLDPSLNESLNEKDSKSRKRGGRGEAVANGRASGGATYRKSERGSDTAEDLEIDLEKVKASKDLNLVGKEMAELDQSVLDLATEARTSVLNLSKNVLTCVPETIESLCDFLTELKLDFNRLTSLPASLGRCSRLQYFSFQNNQIDSLPEEFDGLKNLREINMSYNKFSSIPPCLYSLRHLEILIAVTNKIDTVDADGLKNLPMLGTLDLRNNNIAQVPCELGLLNQLKSLNLEGNAFRVPSYHILSQGTDAVLRFLHNRIPK